MKLPFITKRKRTKRHNIAAAIALSLVFAMLASTATPIAVMASADAIAATDNNNSVSTGEVKQALLYTPGILDASNQTETTSDSDFALKTATAGATVDVPKDASEGVTLSTTDGTSLDITLPNADNATDAKQIANGVVAYGATNGSANAVQANEDGSVRMLTVIDNQNAPTEYNYKVTVPNGGHIELTTDGGAIVLDNQSYPVAAVQTPWAKDAKGKQIKTWFTTDGITLTQHVKHNVRGVVYPVVADPAWLAIAAAIIGAAASYCATAVLSGIGLDGVRWALQRNDWYWNKKVEDALWNCAWGAAGGGILKFAPASVKSWTATQIKNLSKNLLRWKI